MTGLKAGHVRQGSTRRPVHEVQPVEVQWLPGEPPEPQRSESWHFSYQHEAIARTLRQRPGVWAELVSLRAMAAPMATQIRKGTLSAYRPGGSFEAVSRRGCVYARYVGVGRD